LEGSCDLARSRTAIIGVGAGDQFERLLLHPRDYGFEGEDVPLAEEITLGQRLLSVLQGESSELARSAIWNGGFYLWQAGAAPSLESGLQFAQELLTTGQALATLETLQAKTAELHQPETAVL
jgi:anthranilate phosphoribosyltransferase